MNLENYTKTRFDWYKSATGFDTCDKRNTYYDLNKYWMLYNDRQIQPVVLKIYNDIAKPVDLKEEDFNPEIDRFMESLGKEKNE